MDWWLIVCALFAAVLTVVDASAVLSDDAGRSGATRVQTATLSAFGEAPAPVPTSGTSASQPGGPVLSDCEVVLARTLPVGSRGAAAASGTRAWDSALRFDVC